MYNALAMQLCRCRISKCFLYFCAFDYQHFLPLMFNIHTHDLFLPETIAGTLLQRCF